TGVQTCALPISYSKKKFVWICPFNSNHKWKASVNDRSRGSDCPKCSKQNSKPQQKLHQIISDIWVGVDNHSRYKHPDLRYSKSNRKMELDIWLPSLLLAFEYQGPGHYRPIYGEKSLKETQRRDREKRRACKKVGIKLIEVKYTMELTEENVRKLLLKNGVVL